MDDHRRDELRFLQVEESFRTFALKIIKKMMELITPNPVGGDYNRKASTLEENLVYADEFLHSILFLGKIHEPPFLPSQIVSDGEMLQKLQNIFPRPFMYYSSQLPRQCPFSCILDMVVNLTGEEREDEIKDSLRDFIRRLELSGREQFVCTTICVSQNLSSADQERYYGVSMSTKGRKPGQIMVAASCLKTWDSCVANAVMTFYPGRAKKAYFGGTITLPPYVRCQAFSVSSGDKMKPCLSCASLFGLRTNDTHQWAHGNCAEPQSLSKLFKDNRDVKEEVEKGMSYNNQNRGRAQEATRKHLVNLLGQVKFEWDLNFYIPQ